MESMGNIAGNTWLQWKAYRKAFFIPISLPRHISPPYRGVAVAYGKSFLSSDDNAEREGEDWRNVLTKANAGSKKWKEYNKIKTSDIVTKEKVGMCNKGMNKFRPLILLCSEIEILLELMKEKGRMRNVSGNFWM